MKYLLFIVTFLIVLTALIVSINPQLNKTVTIVDSNFIVKNSSNIKSSNLKVDNKNVTKNKDNPVVNSKNSVKKVENIAAKNINTNTNKEKQLLQQERESQARKLAEQKRQEMAKRQQQEYAKKLAQQKSDMASQKKTVQPSKKSVQQKTQIQPKVTPSTPKKTVTTKVEPTKKATATNTSKPATATKASVPKQTVQPPVKQENKLTEYQETILWNQWRANVCNNITSRLDKQFTNIVPVGTVYTYSFNVDNQRRITNVVVKISRGYVNPTTQQGIYMIQRAIYSLNLSSILTFPSGSQRTVVKVSSGIERTAAQTNNLKANSFNDVETVTKQK